MNRREVIESITNDVKFMQKWRLLINDGTMDKILELCNCFRSPYNKDALPSDVLHIQSERNGGIKAWDKLEYLISSLPFKESKGSIHSEEYIGYVKDHVAKRKQLDYLEDDQ